MMKLSSLKILWIAAIFFCNIPLTCFGQFDSEKQLNIYLNHDLIQKKKIRSLVIYADINERGILQYGGESGKIAEIEFDKNGYQVYKNNSKNGGNLPFIYYGRGSMLTIDSFDQDGNKISTYFENHLFSIQSFMKYNHDGKLVRIENIQGDDTLAVIGFVWIAGKLTEFKPIFSSKKNKNIVNEFNSEGKITKHISGLFKTLYSYQPFDNSLITTKKIFKSDSLVYTESYTTVIQFDQITHYLRKNSAGELEIEMSAQIDQFGNAISCFLNDKTKHREEEIYQPISIRIENKYDDQNLLLKRKFYYFNAELDKEVLTKIETYLYDTAPLSYKIQKGSLMDELMHENMND